MDKNVIFLYLNLIAFSLSAQDCTKAILQQKPGTWKAGQQGFVRGVTSSDLAREKATLTGIHKMITSHYSPKGCEISYSYVFSTESHFLSDPFHYEMYILRYICDENSTDKSKYYVDYSTTTTVNITANVIYSLNNLYAADLRDDFRGYLKLKERPQKKDGYYFLGEEVVGDSQMENKTIDYQWLITYDDRLPFSYVSRKEYLLIQKKRLEQTIKDSPSEANYYNKFVNTINTYLKRSENDLAQPAICMWNEEEQFEEFVEEGTKGSFIAVRPNMDYYNKKLPRSSPQFFTVVYTLTHGDPVFEENISGIKKAIDFTALKNMLGK